MLLARSANVVALLAAIEVLDVAPEIGILPGTYAFFIVSQNESSLGVAVPLITQAPTLSTT